VRGSWVKEVKEIMGDTYNIKNAPGAAIGKNAHTKDTKIIQINNPKIPNSDFDKLAIELVELRKALKQESINTDDKELDNAIVLVGKAEEAATEHDENKMLQNLKKGGKWALKVSQEIGVKLTTELLKKMLLPE